MFKEVFKLGDLREITMPRGTMQQTIS